MAELWAKADAFLAVWRSDITLAHVYALTGLIVAIIILRIIRMLLKQ